MIIAPLVELARQLAIAAGRAAADRLVSAVRRRVESPADEAPPQPLPYSAVEHQRAQERSAVEASRVAAAARAAAAATPQVRAATPAERVLIAEFLAFCRAEPLPTDRAGWLEREAQARARWPEVADLFDGWGVDIVSSVGVRGDP